MCHILCISLYNSLPTPFFYGFVYLGSGLKGVSSIQTCFFFFFFLCFLLLLLLSKLISKSMIGFWVVFLKLHNLLTNIRRKFKQKKVGNSR